MFIRSRMLLRLVAGAALMGASAFAGAQAQDAVKIGLILPMTGGQASTGKQIDNAVKLYMQQKGDTVAGRKIEIILKDDARRARQYQAARAGTDRQRQGRYYRRLRRHARGPCGGAAGDPGQGA